MRTVRDSANITWICLELPEIPHDQLKPDVAELVADDAVAIECNSGAARVIALVAPGWDDELTDLALVAAIEKFR